MAGEWIKMRLELLTHPRFIGLCNFLIYTSDEPGFLSYVCGEDVVLDLCDRNESVTEWALQRVTVQTLRDVTLVTLLKTWCAVSAHCKVEKYDAVMSPMMLSDIDGLAGFSGFGAAMKEVGWVRERSHNVLVFPNFLEHNEPSSVRAGPMTNAERQRKFRESQRIAVTEHNENNENNGRVDKRRRDKRGPPNPPKERNGECNGTADPAIGKIAGYRRKDGDQ